MRKLAFSPALYSYFQGSTTPALSGRGELLREWDTEKNGGKTPDDVSMGSHQKVWRKCAKGHSYRTSVSSRAGFGGDRPGGDPPTMPEGNTL